MCRGGRRASLTSALPPNAENLRESQFRSAALAGRHSITASGCVEQLFFDRVVDRVFGAFRVWVAIDEARAQRDDLSGEVDLHLVDRVANPDHAGPDRSPSEERVDLARRNASLEALVGFHMLSFVKWGSGRPQRCVCPTLDCASVALAFSMPSRNLVRRPGCTRTARTTKSEEVVGLDILDAGRQRNDLDAGDEESIVPNL
jgi:hypothetical protein